LKGDKKIFTGHYSLVELMNVELCDATGA